MSLRTAVATALAALSLGAGSAERTYTLEELESRPIGKGFPWEGYGRKGEVFGFRYQFKPGIELTGTEVWSVECNGELVPFFVSRHNGYVRRDRFVKKGDRFREIPYREGAVAYVWSFTDEVSGLPRQFVPPC